LQGIMALPLVAQRMQQEAEYFARVRSATS
jgi:hypothetical protein